MSNRKLDLNSEQQLQQAQKAVPSEDDDYAHCAKCDKVINLDVDKWSTSNDNTYCEQCGDEL